MTGPTCRFCRSPLHDVFADLGMSPLANSYLRPEEVNRMEPFYPLRVLVCGECFLVQLEEFETPAAIFSDYAYFSSYSTTWVEHSRRYVAQMVERFGLHGSNHVVELASNDGYLLQYFHERQIPVLGIEPAANVAKVALQKGIPTIVEFFGAETAGSLAADSSADLLIGNNVLAHVPDINDFVAGMRILLKDDGVITMEFPHLAHLMADNQFDTIYHEHFSYFSFLAVQRIFAAHDLVVFDVEELPTHGGSLRIYARHAADESKPVTAPAQALAASERESGVERLDHYERFSETVREAKHEVLEFLIAEKRKGRRIIGYGAPAKGNTLLNYCGVGTDFLDFTVDVSPHKQGCFLPGTHIPIRAPAAIREERPDIVFILPWNLKDEVMEQHAYIAEWGARFVARAPRMTFLR